MSKRQPTNRELLDEIERLREEVQRLNARPIQPVIVPQPYPIVPAGPWPSYPRPWITWTAPVIPPTFTGGSTIGPVTDNTTTVVWDANTAFTPTS
jgi:hypothetical protein